MSEFIYIELSHQDVDYINDTAVICDIGIKTPQGEHIFVTFEPLLPHLVEHFEGRERHQYAGSPDAIRYL